MNSLQICKVLSGVESFESASDEARLEFYMAVHEHDCAADSLVGFWEWFYRGWCTSQDHQSVGWSRAPSGRALAERR